MGRTAANLVARLLTYTGVRPMFEAIERTVRMPFLVAVNYHWTPADRADQFDAQLAYLADRFISLDRARLLKFFDGTLSLEKPGLVLCFDDGNRNTYEVAAPLLERRGLHGWYFAIAGTIDPTFTEAIPGIHRKFSMTRDQLRDLHARGHVVGSHSYAHVNVGTAPHAALEREVVRSRAILEDAIGAPVDSFCYPFGTPDSFSPASQEIIQATYRLAFNSCPYLVRPGDSPLAIGRHPLEPEMDSHLLRLKTSGLVDWRYRRARRRFLASVPASYGESGPSDDAVR